MLGRLFRLFLILPLIAGVWAYANTIGATAHINKATGLNIPDVMTIPGMTRAVEASEEVNQVARQAKRQARRAAIKAVRGEVEKKYGPEAARLVPDDLTLREAKNFDFGAFEAVLAAKGIDPSIPSLPKQPTKPKQTKPKSGANVYAKALATLDTLAVKGRAPMTGYDRSQFGSEWSDKAGAFKWTGNGCDTRNDVLARDLVNVKRDGSCKVATGTLAIEPYTGKKNVKFIAAGPYANNLDIEHLVSLGNAWASGAQKIGADKRAALANDPINLLAVDPSSNRQKGDADFATWLPSNKAFRCDYATKQIAVKAKYGLWVTSAEKGAMRSVLGGCAKK